ncbi:MAG: hypothetical protein Q9227_001163 [Pyrenula ochraceoflavens]
MTSQVLLPGDAIPSSTLTPNTRLLRGIHPSSPPTSKQAGTLQSHPKKRTLTLTPTNIPYTPLTGDLVIAQVQRTVFEEFSCSLAPHTPSAFLPHLAFEGANKKTRPQLKSNDLVYAKVTFAARNMETQLSCVDPATGKSEPEMLGPLTGGMVFDVSVALAERLLRRDGVVVLEELGEKMQGGFEVAVGKNGRVWVDCPQGGVRGVLAVGRCLRETDERRLTEDEQRRVVERVVAEMGLG